MSQQSYQHEVENYFISWDELQRDSLNMAKRLKGQGWEQIIALTKGGLMPATLIAKELNIPLIESLSVKERVQRSDLSVIRKHFDSEPKTLLVDDLVDTGKTARAVKKALPDSYFVSIYAKPAGIPDVDDYVTEIEQDSWLHFPWDIDLALNKEQSQN